ncbi:hypothetical protein [Chitinimonas taiwanensis]|uniref:Uncharacterized protein n=1 Tax=Chitinimonas taiwanensis DSM 18899 TaxID=1121279 RepID=A0A1K2HQB0_9NEIS|nr:hypothetical protein [Chitinimonas taiwanensis]SFZ78442.1 hypothetical protein SAMN02745887_02985 [Chitinimonas taiwanensis DSM 18899]
MRKLSVEEYRQLDSKSLAERIDDFLQAELPIPIKIDSVPFASASAKSILNSERFQNLEEGLRKRALEMFFRSVFQSEACVRYLVLGGSSGAKSGLGQETFSPRDQSISGALRQAQLVSARIAFECFMEFLSLVESGILFKKKSRDSKLGGFIKWLQGPNNSFGWVVFYVLPLKRFDRNYRTPEVHGTSHVAIEALRGAPVSMNRSNDELSALNLIVNLWQLVVQTLNNEEIRVWMINPEDEKLFPPLDKWREIDLGKWCAEYEEDILLTKKR